MHACIHSSGIHQSQDLEEFGQNKVTGVNRTESRKGQNCTKTPAICSEVTQEYSSAN